MPVLWGILLTLIVATHIPVIVYLLHGQAVNQDELEMTLSSADRFLGIPPVSLAWPGGPQQFLGLAAIVSDFAIRGELSQKGFLQFLSDLYRDSWRTLTHMRVVVALMSGLGLAFLVFPMLRVTGSYTLGAICVIELALIPQVWMHNHMASADGMSLGLLCLAFSMIGYSSYWPILVGVFLGLAFAQKVTAVFAFPFILAMAFEHKKNIKVILLCLFFVLVGFVLGCPYVWVDPVRLGKALLGNTAGRAESASFLPALENLVSTVTPFLFCSAAVGMVLLIRRRKILVATSIIIGLGVNLVLIASGGVNYSRYFLWTAVPLVFLFGVCLEFFSHIGSPFDATKFRCLVKCCVVGVVGIALLYNSWVCVKDAYHLMDIRTRKNDLVCLILKENQGVGSPLILPTDFLPYVAKWWSRESVQAQRLKTSEAHLSGSGLLDFVVGRGLSAPVVQALSGSFTEREQAWRHRLKIMTYSAPASGLNCQIWTNPTVAKRHGFFSWHDASHLWDEGKASLVLHSHERRVARGMDAIREFSYLPRRTH